MKIGVRKPSISKSVKARTTGRAKRAIKRTFDPTYGKKGAGWIKNPERAAYNAVYNRTTTSVIPKTSKKTRSAKGTNSFAVKFELFLKLAIFLVIAIAVIRIVLLFH